MGEEPWRVTVSGAPGLDNLNEFSPLDKKELEDLLGLTLDPAPLLVTFHPVTLEYEDTEYHITQLLDALDRLKMPVVFTFPNADTYGRVIIRAVKQYTTRRDDAVVLPSLGTRVYFSLMGHAFAMVGNSSSGIIEAASFGLPVVNIGSRQAGRHRSANVMDSGYDTGSILKAVARATDEAFRKNIAGMVNPYGNGRASERIVKVLKSVDLGRKLLMKKFHDIERS
jgi:UDP-hydrolysing UDP-N-acetyl-D-glucosamine 2-epimerase